MMQMKYERVYLPEPRDKVVEKLITILNELNLDYIKQPNEYRYSIHAKKEKWRPFAFFLGFGYRVPPNTPIVDILVLEGYNNTTEVVFRITKGYELTAIKIINKLKED